MPRKQTVLAPLFVRIPFKTPEEKEAFEKAVLNDTRTTGEFLRGLILEHLKKINKK